MSIKYLGGVFLCAVCFAGGAPSYNLGVNADPHLTSIVVGKVEVLFERTYNGNTYRDSSLGSCFPIKYYKKNLEKNGRLRLITALHLIQEKNIVKINVTLWNMDKVLLQTNKGKIINVDKKLDVALLEVPCKAPVPCMRLSNEEPVFGAKVIAAGCTAGQKPIYTEGFVCHEPSFKELKMSRVVSAPIFGGSSGGPVTYKGTNTVMGMTRAILTAMGQPVTHVHFVTTAKAIKEWLDNG